MMKLISAAIAGATSFAATNIDDILILMLFFSQTSSTFKRRHIFLGQYLGFSVLVLASLPGFLGGLLIPKPWIGLLGLVPAGIGISQLLHHTQDDDEVQTLSDEGTELSKKLPILSSLTKLIAPQTYQVAGVTVANGGDNIGIYVPLFASSDLASLGVILVVFFGLIGVWCYVADQLAQHPLVSRLLTRYGHAIAPFVLIGLGIFIVLENETYRLLPMFD